MKRSGLSSRRPTVACAACGRRKRLTGAGKMPPHHPPGKPSLKCYETAYTLAPPERKPAKPRKRIPPQNRKRAAQQRLADFGPKADWIRTLPCSTCRRSAPSDPSHIKSRGAGGTVADLVPMCRVCHDQFHAMGRKTFAQTKGCDLVALVIAYEEQWQLAVKTTTPGRVIPQPTVRNGNGPNDAISSDLAQNAESPVLIDTT